MVSGLVVRDHSHPSTFSGTLRAMSLRSTHPDYNARQADWSQMSDTFDGQRTVKAAGDTYLPATASMRADGYPEANTEGTAQYCAYKERANFPEIVREAAEALVGVMMRKPPVITVPASMEPLKQRLTPRGETAETLLTRIYEAQLVNGRIGLLVDVPNAVSVATALPWIVTYSAASTLNWLEETGPEGGDELQLVVLDETGYVMTPDLDWEEVESWRVLALNTGKFPVDVAGRVYITGTSVKDTNMPSEWIAPKIGEPLPRIPFVFCNAVDLAPEPGIPPLLFLSNMALTIYRGDADYRHALFMSAQETMVIRGARTDSTGTAPPSGPITVGPGAIIEVEAAGGVDYAGISGRGLAEQRTALENDRKEADARGGQILQRKSGGVESGDALSTRVASRTATLARIALTGAAALRMALQHCGRFMGLSEDELETIEVHPNLDFGESDTGSKTLVELMTAKLQGAPLALRSIHQVARRLDLTDLSFEDELSQIEEEKALDIVPTPAQEPIDEDEEDDPEEDTE